MPEFDLASWTVLLAPKGTPAPILSPAAQGDEQSGRFGRVVLELGITMGQQ